jgi:hypothetical protein
LQVRVEQLSIVVIAVLAAACAWACARGWRGAEAVGGRMLRRWCLAWALLCAGAVLVALNLLAEPWRTALPYLLWLPGVLGLLAACTLQANQRWSDVWALGLSLPVLGALLWLSLDPAHDRLRIVLMQGYLVLLCALAWRVFAVAAARGQPVPWASWVGVLLLLLAALIRGGAAWLNPQATYAFLSGLHSPAQLAYFLLLLLAMPLLTWGAVRAART